MVVDKSRVDKLGCYSTNGIHIICTFEMSICFVNWNRVEHLANISTSSYQIWYHLKLTYNLDKTNWVYTSICALHPTYIKQKSPNDSDSIRCKESTLVLQCEV